MHHGFTLAEVLVVVVIAGILAAIGIPSYLNQVAKAQESEPRQNLKAILNGQEAYYTEHGVFAQTWQELNVGLTEQTSNYNYSLFDAENATGVIVNSDNPDLRSFLGGIKVFANKNGVRFVVVQCRSIKTGIVLEETSLRVGKSQVLCGRYIEPI